MFWRRKSSDELPESALADRLEFERMREQLAAFDRRIRCIERRLTPVQHRHLAGALASLGRTIGREEQKTTARETA